MAGKDAKGAIPIGASVIRHPAILGAGAASLGALLVTNAVAFMRGLEAPWLLAAVILTDMLVIGVAIVVAAREVLLADTRTEATQAQLESIVDSAMDAIVSIDEDQNIVLFNRAAEQVFGFARSEVMGTPLERFVPERFRAAHRAHIQHFASTGVTSRRMGDVTTLWGLRADGSEFPIEASISQASEGGHRYFTVILRDVTLRKGAEDALRESQRELRELSARALEAREDEKTRIARELHDELGQLLTGLKMDLTWLQEQLPAGGEVSAKAMEMSALLDQTVSATRRIAADLRPLMLDDLGLADAASWLVDDFAKRSGIQCRIEVLRGEALDDVSGSVSTTVYRAIQESLTNVARHSGGKNAWLVLAVEDRSVLVEVEDDGQGIAPEDLAKARSLGLKGMRERIAYLGGSFEIMRAPRGGTRVRLRVPLGGKAEHPAYVEFGTPRAAANR